MTRALHTQDICTLSDNDLQTELTDRLLGDTLVIVPEDDRLKSLVPINGQVTLFGTQLEFPADTTFYSAPLYNTHLEQREHLPRNKNERFHFDDNSFDTAITLFSMCGYFQRGPPFLDLTRIVRPGGTIVAVTGLQPEADTDHDAKWWVPKSNDADLEEIALLRHENYQTPIVLSDFTVTTRSARHPNATIVTGDS